MKTFPGIIVRQHHIDQKHMGLLREQCAELRKGHLRYYCNQAGMKNGGRIPCNAAAICETFKISCLTGRPLYERRFGMPFNGPVIFEQWSNITQFLPKTNRVYTSSTWESHQDFFRLSIFRGENLERRPPKMENSYSSSNSLKEIRFWEHSP